VLGMRGAIASTYRAANGTIALDGWRGFNQLDVKSDYLGQRREVARRSADSIRHLGRDSLGQHHQVHDVVLRVLDQSLQGARATSSILVPQEDGFAAVDVA